MSRRFSPVAGKQVDAFGQIPRFAVRGSDPTTFRRPGKLRRLYMVRTKVVRRVSAILCSGPPTAETSISPE